MTLPDLIAQLESATGGSAELDRAIMLLDGWVFDGINQVVPMWIAPKGRAFPYGCSASISAMQGEYPYTRMLDAAVALVPEGWTVARINQNDDKTWAAELREGYLTSYGAVVFGGERHKDATPALAICIAALKAILHNRKQES